MPKKYIISKMEIAKITGFASGLTKSSKARAQVNQAGGTKVCV